MLGDEQRAGDRASLHLGTDDRCDPIARDEEGFYVEPEVRITGCNHGDHMLPHCFRNWCYQPDDFPYVFVIHFPHPDNSPASKANAPPGTSMASIVKRLHDAGLKTRLEWSSTHDSVFCRIGCTCVHLCG